MLDTSERSGLLSRVTRRICALTLHLTERRRFVHCCARPASSFIAAVAATAAAGVAGAAAAAAAPAGADTSTPTSVAAAAACDPYPTCSPPRPSNSHLPRVQPPPPPDSQQTLPATASGFRQHGAGKRANGRVSWQQETGGVKKLGFWEQCNHMVSHYGQVHGCSRGLRSTAAPVLYIIELTQYRFITFPCIRALPLVPPCVLPPPPARPLQCGGVTGLSPRLRHVVVAPTCRRQPPDN